MPLILGTNSIKDTGYDVANSLRFNIGSTDYLNRTSGTSSNTNVWSLSMWIKRSDVSSSGSQKVFSAGSGSTDRTEIYFGTDDKLNIFRNISGSEINIVTSMVFRDPSSWYHTLWVWNGTAITLYVNGASVTLSATNLGTNKINGSSTVHRIGIQHDNSSQNFGGYLAEVTFLDGTAVSDATSFGEFDSDSPNIWKPKNVSGLTFGNNGFYLDFEDSSALGNDAAGSNNFTVNNLTAVDQSTDTCTNNFATLNPLATSSFNDLSEGSLKITGNTATNDGETFSTFVMPNATAKWYWELKCTNKYSGGNPKFGFIQAKRGFRLQNGGAGYGGAASGTLDIMVRPDGKTLENGSTSGSAVIGTWDTGDILSFALDSVNGAFYVGINGTWQTSGNPESGASKTGAVKTWTPTDSKCDDGQAVCIGSYNGSVTEANFGSPSFAISSGNTDADGHGNMEFSVPSGYFVLNSKNLAEYG